MSWSASSLTTAFGVTGVGGCGDRLPRWSRLSRDEVLPSSEVGSVGERFGLRASLGLLWLAPIEGGRRNDCLNPTRVRL